MAAMRTHYAAFDILAKHDLHFKVEGNHLYKVIAKA